MVDFEANYDNENNDDISENTGFEHKLFLWGIYITGKFKVFWYNGCTPPPIARIFQYMNENGKFIDDGIPITIEETDTLDDIKQKLKLIIPDVSNTQDIFFASVDDEKTRINTIDALKNSTGIIVFTIAESLDGGRRRRSSTPRKSSSSSRRRRSTKRRTASRKQQKRRRGSRRAH